MKKIGRISVFCKICDWRFWRILKGKSWENDSLFGGKEMARKSDWHSSPEMLCNIITAIVTWDFVVYFQSYRLPRLDISKCKHSKIDWGYHKITLFHKKQKSGQKQSLLTNFMKFEITLFFKHWLAQSWDTLTWLHEIGKKILTFSQIPAHHKSNTTLW